MAINKINSKSIEDGIISADDLANSTITNAKLANNTITINGEAVALGGSKTIAEYDDDLIQSKLAQLGFKVATNGSLARYSLTNQTIDEFEDSTGINTTASTNEFFSTGVYSGSDSSTTGTTTTTYSYDGSDDTISLTSGQTLNGTVKCWGAGGGGDHTGSGQTGGGGGFISGTISYPSDGTDLIVSVGQGGAYGTYNGSGGSGGGYSGVFEGTKTHGNAVIIAGAGGGAGDGGSGGGGGGTTGSSGGGTNAGGGGSQVAGGAAGGQASAVGTDAVAGSALTGGNGGDEGPGGKGSAVTNNAFNGGGDGGEEPGGYRGGGGGGGGYYGGGGGSASSSGGGGGGGSSYYNSSYISSVTNTQGTSGGAAAGTGDANYPGSVGDGGGEGSNGENGAVYMSYTISTVSVNNMTLISTSQATNDSTVPTQADLVLLYKNTAGTATLNTDLKVYISRDGGSTYTQGTLVGEGDYGSNKIIAAVHDLDISSQPSEANMVWKIETLNQTVSKRTDIEAVSFGWK